MPDGGTKFRWAFSYPSSKHGGSSGRCSSGGRGRCWCSCRCGPPGGSSSSRRRLLCPRVLGRSDPRIAAGVVVGASAVGLALALSRFYRDNRDDADDAIRDVIERRRRRRRRPRRDGEELQPDPEVVAIVEGSLYVHVGFRTEDGYEFFSALYAQEYIQTRLKEEFKTLGFQGEIRVSLERSQVPGRQEEEEERAGRVDPGVAEMFRRMRIQDVPYRDSPTAERLIQACRTMERGAEMLTSSGYSDAAGLTLLAEGIIMWEVIDPEDCKLFLYDPDCLHLDKKRLDHLTSTQLKHNPADSSCLFLQGALLPWGDNRVDRLRQTMNTILQNGEKDPLHPYLHHISCMLALSLRAAADQPALALAAFATALMYKSDHPPTLFWTAECSMKVSKSDAIQQFHQYLRAAPPCDPNVPIAHYNLTVLYGEQQPVDREKVETHYRRGQEAEKNKLPVFRVQESLKDEAKEAYNRATGNM
ncbi:Hypp7168 [Branchiostoma lanceolatum]|uniref:Hypp7168 protein n=1 Tax=Branchiostoma lanceolatum TaxID=7740 RepID=A0A8J9YY01_BRALA|nr:Hypp7168 [Branchiostoma lanceolatum]